MYITNLRIAKLEFKSFVKDQSGDQDDSTDDNIEENSCNEDENVDFNFYYEYKPQQKTLTILGI